MSYFMTHLVVYYHSGKKAAPQILYNIVECHIKKPSSRAVLQHSLLIGKKQNFKAAHACDGLLHLKEVLQCLNGLLKGY